MNPTTVKLLAVQIILACDEYIAKKTAKKAVYGTITVSCYFACRTVNFIKDKKKAHYLRPTFP